MNKADQAADRAEKSNMAGQCSTTRPMKRAASVQEGCQPFWRVKRAVKMQFIPSSAAANTMAVQKMELGITSRGPFPSSIRNNTPPPASACFRYNPHCRQRLQQCFDAAEHNRTIGAFARLISTVTRTGHPSIQSFARIICVPGPRSDCPVRHAHEGKRSCERPETERCPPTSLRIVIAVTRVKIRK
jgi:hypothetical protein